MYGDYSLFNDTKTRFEVACDHRGRLLNEAAISDPALPYAIMASAAELQDFIDRQRLLLAKERGAEIERSSLLLSNCGPKLLEQKGFSLGGLGVVGMHVGLGGKTYAFICI